jgi:hypothetical protein
VAATRAADRRSVSPARPDEQGQAQCQDIAGRTSENAVYTKFGEFTFPEGECMKRLENLTAPKISPWRGPKVLSQLLKVLSSRCMVSTLSKPAPQSM